MDSSGSHVYQTGNGILRNNVNNEIILIMKYDILIGILVIVLNIFSESVYLDLFPPRGFADRGICRDGQGHA